MEPDIESVNTLTDDITLSPRVIRGIQSHEFTLHSLTGSKCRQDSLFGLVSPSSDRNDRTFIPETWPGPVTCGGESELSTHIFEIFGVSIVD